jgi:hypothetical protein
VVGVIAPLGVLVFGVSVMLLTLTGCRYRTRCQAPSATGSTPTRRVLAPVTAPGHADRYAEGTSLLYKIKAVRGVTGWRVRRVRAGRSRTTGTARSTRRPAP